MYFKNKYMSCVLANLMIGVNPSRMELIFFNLFKKEQTTALREVYWIVTATTSQVLIVNQTALFFQCSSQEAHVFMYILSP